MQGRAWKTPTKFLFDTWGCGVAGRICGAWRTELTVGYHTARSPLITNRRDSGRRRGVKGLVTTTRVPYPS